MKSLFVFLLFLTGLCVGCGSGTEDGSITDASEFDDMGIELGEAQTMTGEEFQKFLASQPQNSNPNEKYLYLKIPEALDPLERGKKYGRPIGEILSCKGLGEVTGGGSMMRKGGKVDFVGLDIVTEDPPGAIAAVKKKLREIGAPKGTVILQDDDGQEIETMIWEEDSE